MNIIFSKEVKDAKHQNKPILALESTIITHGMPFPKNIEMVKSVERISREKGVTPATIAVIDGNVHIGLDQEQLEDFSQRENVDKLSRPDLAYCIASKGTGATTVAATMILANHVGIDVFATGGIGGVHRGAQESFDVSADLQELAQTNTTVVCAGAKAILDIPKTLEMLETLGVPVITYKSDELPAFYSRKSGLKSPLRFDQVETIANTMQMQKKMNMKGGLLICNPIPIQHEIPYNEIMPIIEGAIDQAEAQGIKSKEVTPFLLDALFHSTKGKSLEANIALVQNNVRLAAEIALAFHQNLHR